MSFQKSSNFSIDNSHFFNGDKLDVNYVTVSNQIASADPMSLLLLNCAIEATHESSTAQYAPKCKAGTRKAIISDLMGWIEKKSSPILWFPGPAGGGKTCIQREVARLSSKQGRLAATYFFSTRVAGLDHGKPLVATIAYQLAQSIPEFKPFVEREIKANLGIFSKSLNVQLEVLILKPLQALLESNPKLAQTSVRTLVIDGFDECRRVEERRHLLHIFHILATNLTFPFRIIIASRPEFDIRTAFTSRPLMNGTTIVRLDSYDGTSDIRDYLCDEFARIRDTHPSRRHIPPDWPVEDDMETLVSKASSQFIFASTVIKYVDNPRQSPTVALKRAMGIAGSMNRAQDPFADLDALYHLILHPPDVDLALLRRLLSIILDATVSESGRYALTLDFSQLLVPENLDLFLNLDLGTTSITFCDIHSVLYIPESPREGIKFHHKSMQDYLMDPNRSGDLFRPQMETILDLAASCVYHLQYNASGPADLSTRWAVKESSLRWAAYTTTVVKEEHPDSPLPEIILLFHPAVLVQYLFLVDADGSLRISQELSNLGSLQYTIHRKRCSPERGCLKLCQRLVYIEHYRHKIESIFDNVSHKGISPQDSGRLNEYILIPNDSLTGGSKAIYTSYSPGLGSDLTSPTPTPYAESRQPSPSPFIPSLAYTASQEGASSSMHVAAGFPHPGIRLGGVHLAVQKMRQTFSSRSAGPSKTPVAAPGTKHRTSESTLQRKPARPKASSSRGTENPSRTVEKVRKSEMRAPSTKTGASGSTIPPQRKQAPRWNP